MEDKELAMNQAGVNGTAKKIREHPLELGECRGDLRALTERDHRLPF